MKYNCDYILVKPYDLQEYVVVNTLQIVSIWEDKRNKRTQITMTNGAWEVKESVRELYKTLTDYDILYG